MVRHNVTVTNRLEDIMSRYDDIINLPHHVSSTRTPMPMENRAAQFAPFAALSGHDDAIEETARLTTEKPELSPGELDKLSKRLVYAIEKDAEIVITFFQPDTLKQGGSIRQTQGKVKNVDETDGVIVLTDKQTVRLDCVLSIDSNIFDEIE